MKFAKNEFYSQGRGEYSDFTVEEGYLVNDEPADNTPFTDHSKRVKRIFSRVFLALFIYLAVSQIALFVIDFCIMLFAGYDKYVAITSDATFAIVLSSVCQYIFGFAALIPVMKSVPRSSRSRQRSGMNAADILLFFFVCQFFAYLGSFIGNGLNSIISYFTGTMPDNTLDSLINAAPVWVIILFAVIIGPIFEEIIFRRFLLDRLNVVGDRAAVIFSSVAFGIFHQNFYQFFYACFIGFVLGFVYVKTRNVLHTIILHVAFNFVGSAIPMLLSDIFAEYDRLAKLITEGVEVDMLAFGKVSLIVMMYSAITLGSAVIGLIIFVSKLRQNKLRISTEAELYLPARRVISVGLVNIGSILFWGICIVFTVLGIILS